MKLMKTERGGEILDRQELDAKITELSKTILSYCVSRTSNRQDAEDLAQNMILEIMKSSQNIRDDKAFYGFMWSVAGNVYRQWYKKKLRVNECELTGDVHDDTGEMDLLAEKNTDICLLRRELSLLSGKYRRATILYYLENKSCAEISNLLSVSESMVKYLLFKSRKILKEGMNMERNYGEQSYRPKKLMLLYMGEGPNQYWSLIDGNKIRQNILWACYNDRLTEDEIALQIGVSLPYIEGDLKKLTEAELLDRDGNFYRTNIIILTEDLKKETASKLQPLQAEIADKIQRFIDANSDAVRSIGFCGSDMSQNSLKWQLTCMILQYAFSRAADSLFAPGKVPVTAFGEHAYVWGAEHVSGGFNCCNITAEERHTDISMYFMDWVADPQTNHNDFYSNINFVKMYAKLARGLATEPNEYEQEIVSELIRRGYAYKKDGRILVTMPTYTISELDELREMLRHVIDETGALFEQINKTIADVLRNHAPAHLKKQVEAIAGMCLFSDAAYVPASMMNKSGYLSTDWDANENATSYVVLN